MVKIEIVRLLFAVGAQLKWSLYHFNIKSMFLNGETVEDVYIEQPKGFVIEGKKDLVYKLNKALYGLKQAPKHGLARLTIISSSLDLRVVQMLIPSIRKLVMKGRPCWYVCMLMTKYICVRGIF